MMIFSGVNIPHKNYSKFSTQIFFPNNFVNRSLCKLIQIKGHQNTCINIPNYSKIAYILYAKLKVLILIKL